MCARTRNCCSTDSLNCPFLHSEWKIESDRLSLCVATLMLFLDKKPFIMYCCPHHSPDKESNMWNDLYCKNTFHFPRINYLFICDSSNALALYMRIICRNVRQSKNKTKGARMTRTHTNELTFLFSFFSSARIGHRSRSANNNCQKTERKQRRRGRRIMTSSPKNKGCSDGYEAIRQWQRHMRTEKQKSISVFYLLSARFTNDNCLRASHHHRFEW